MKANDRRSRSFDSGVTRMPRSPTTIRSPARRSRRRRQKARPSRHHDHGVHALVFDFDPLLADAHVGAVVGGGVEIFRRAPVAFHRRAGAASPESDRRAAQAPAARASRRSSDEPVGRLHLQPQVGRLAIGAADAELFHFEAAVILHDLVEDVLHDVGVDQVAFRFDHFLKWHRTSIVAARKATTVSTTHEAGGTARPTTANTDHLSWWQAERLRALISPVLPAPARPPQSPRCAPETARRNTRPGNRTSSIAAYPPAGSGSTPSA